jgi:hypothetical protein
MSGSTELRLGSGPRWRLLTRLISVEEAAGSIRIRGDERLGASFDACRRGHDDEAIAETAGRFQARSGASRETEPSAAFDAAPRGEVLQGSADQPGCRR